MEVNGAGLQNIHYIYIYIYQKMQKMFPFLKEYINIDKIYQMLRINIRKNDKNNNSKSTHQPKRGQPSNFANPQSHFRPNYM